MRNLTPNLTLAPLHRSFIGFDQLACMADKAARQDKQTAYPPYNVESPAQDKYAITMAVAGFTEDELEIESQQNNLVVRGTKAKVEEQKKYLYQGIAERNFERKFQLGDYVKVVDATIENGMLHIDLVKEIPEAMQPRKIEISSKKSLLDS
jgi:molecular chaperone IbpA